jgi:hypothetical protein
MKHKQFELLKEISVVTQDPSNRPADIPENWIILNAPRPLYGHKQWDGPFLHGIFYAAIDPDDDAGNWMLKNSISLDAWVVAYVTFSQKIEMIKKRYPKYAEKIAVLPTEKIIDQFAYSFHRKTYEYFCEYHDHACQSIAALTSGQSVQVL